MMAIMSNPLFDTLLTLPHENCHFDSGTALFRQGDRVRSLHLVQAGSVHLLRHQIGGFSLTLHRASAGAVLAEASLFSDAYHCDAIATQETQTVSIAKARVTTAMADDPTLARNWAAYLAREVQATRFRAETLALRTVAERLDAWLAMHGGRMPPRGEWNTVAGEIGVSAEALYRELAKRRGPDGVSR